MIYKKNNQLDPNNYRPISLISNLGKIFESILKDRIYSFAENDDIIPNNQSGFRKKKALMINFSNYLKQLPKTKIEKDKQI